MIKNPIGFFRRYFVFVTIAAATMYSLMFLARNKAEINLFRNDGPIPLRNILEEEEKMKNSDAQQIFFLETHLNGTRNLQSARQACSVEAAARTNPDFDVYLLFATNESKVVMEQSPLYHALLAYPNIHIRYMNLREFSEGTPLEQFMIEDRLAESSFRIEHTSDVMRILTLYKYGGMYLDLDVLSIFPVRIIDSKNFVCLERSNHFSNAIIRLDLNAGQKYSAAYVERIRTSYSPKSWADNGPDMISPAFLSFCNGTDLVWDKDGQCKDLTAIPNQKCFAIMYSGFHKFYEEEFKSEILKTIRETRGYFIHIWNKMLAFNNKSYKLEFNSTAPYVELAKVFCPSVANTRINF